MRPDPRRVWSRRAGFGIIQGMKQMLAPVLVAACLRCGAAPLPLVPWPADVRSREGSAPASVPVSDVRDASLGAEEYRLSVSPEGVTVASSGAAGAFYARKTLDQLRRPDGSLPCVEISDRPRFAWRGVLIDESRHFFGKDVVKRVIDRMAQFKLNVLHWHLVDSHGWRLQIDRYPELTARGAVRPVPDWDRHVRDEDGSGEYGPYFYTKAEVRDIIAYAAARHVKIVPEIELPGHSREVILCHPGFSCLPWSRFAEMMRTSGKYDQAGALCLGNDEVIRFLENVFDEVCELFPGDTVHIGGDECPRGNWKECPKCQARIAALGLKGEDALQSWATGHFVDYLAKKGRKAIGWDEILQGGLAEGALVMSWRGAEGGIAAARAGHQVVMCPHTYCYLDYPTGEKDDECAYPGFCAKSFLPLEKVYSLDPCAGLSEEHSRFVLGSQSLNWAESTWNESMLQFKMWPRTCASAEVLWTGPGVRDFGDFKARLRPVCARMVREGVNMTGSVVSE